MGKNFALFALLLLVGTVMAAYTEVAQVQVVDSMVRPIGGAGVYAVYQLNKRVGYVTGKTVYTKPDGYVNITFYNNEFNINDSSTAYTLYAIYGTQNISKPAEYIANRRWDLQIQVPAHYVIFAVKDQQGRPLGANITAMNVTKAVDGAGQTYFQLADGTQDYFVEALGVVKQGSVLVDSDKTETIEMRSYTLALSVVDQNGMPLNASVLVLGKEYRTDGNGELLASGIGESPVDVDIEYAGQSKVVSLNLESGGETEIVIDRVAPLISGVSSSVVDGAGRVRFSVADVGVKASGIDANVSIRVIYTVGGVQQDANVFPLGGNGYEAEIPMQPANSVVFYTIKAADRDGNEAEAQGQYTVVGTSQQKPMVVPTASGGQVLGDIDPLQAVGAVVILVIIVALFVYVKKRMDEAKPPPEMVP